MLFVVLVVLLLGGGYAGLPKLPLLGPQLRMTATALAAPARPRIGRLTWLGGLRLRSEDPAFGGFSALAVQGARFTLLGDGGNFIRLTLGADLRPRRLAAGALPAGPRTGWEKRDRDSESLTLGPDGSAWVGFESVSAIWRYAPGLVRPARGVRPRAMRKWSRNGGPEALARLHDGRFLVIGETARWPKRPGRAAILFAGDPVRRPGAGFGFSYLPAAGFDPTDVAQLPSGDLLVLERRWLLPARFRSRLAIVRLAALRPGAVVRGREVARLAPPFPTENYEAVAVTREGPATIVWLANDNDQMWWRDSYLLRFRLD